MSARSKPLAIIISLAVSALGLGVVTSGPVAAAAPAWETTFRDDFTGSGLPDASNWLLTLGTKYEGGPDGFGTGEIERMTNDPSNVDVRNGNLYITPQRDATGAWTSARVESTRANFKPADGGVMHVESRLQMPNVTGAEAKGYWPAFWMLGSPYRQNRWSWPAVGEFDIMENVQGLNWTYNVLHCGTWGGPCTEPEGINNGRPGNSGEPCQVTTCQAGFHTYAMEWDRSGPADQLRWYLDGALTFTVNENQVPAQTWSDLADHAGYFVILNVAIGGAFPNKLDGNGGPFPTTKPGVPMVVDYVEVKYAGGHGTPTDPTTPPPTRHDNHDNDNDHLDTAAGHHFDNRDAADHPTRHRWTGQPARDRHDRQIHHPRLGRTGGWKLRRSAVRPTDRDGHRSELHRHRVVAGHAVPVLGARQRNHHPGADRDARVNPDDEYTAAGHNNRAHDPRLAEQSVESGRHRNHPQQRHHRLERLQWGEL